ncbi:hypothetical protein H4R24_001695 [Coemansia sp. RSA 988]|nr:hypothetical protein H4R24_001695 [Coemansia sp. RSA 988]
MNPAAVLYQVPATSLFAMDRNLYSQPFETSGVDTNVASAGLSDFSTPADPSASPLPASPMSHAQRSGYNAMHTLSTATAVRQQQNPGTMSGELQQDPHRRSFDLSALRMSSAAISNMQGLQQQQHGTSLFQPATISTHSGSGFGVGSSHHTIIKPQLQYGTQEPYSPNQLSVASASASASESSALPSPSQESFGNTGASDIALLLSGALQIHPNNIGKPPHPYATLITYAILQHPRKQMTLSEIYNWLMDHYPYFKTAGSGWKNSIRHNLSLNKMFVRIPRPINEPGKGAYWTVDLVELNEAINFRGRPQTHRYSPPRKVRSNTGGAYPMGIVGPAPSFGVVSPSAGPSESLANPLAMGITSSISDKGIMAHMSHDSDNSARRASFQSLPANRYQPYPMPMHNHSLGSQGSLSSTAMQFPELQPSVYNNSTARIPQAPPIDISQGHNSAFGAQPAFPMQPPHGSATGPIPIGAPMAMPHSELVGVSASNTPVAQPWAPQHPAGTIPSALASGELGGIHGPGRTPTLQAGAHLQLRPTPSLPEYLLASQRGMLPTETAASPGALGGSSGAAGNPVASFSLANTTGNQQQGSTAPGKDLQHRGGGNGRAPGSEGTTSIGDLSAYFAFIDAQEQSSTTQPADRQPGYRQHE